MVYAIQIATVNLLVLCTINSQHLQLQICRSTVAICQVDNVLDLSKRVLLNNWFMLTSIIENIFFLRVFFLHYHLMNWMQFTYIKEKFYFLHIYSYNQLSF